MTTKRPRRSQYQAACDTLRRKVEEAAERAHEKAKEMDACWRAVHIAQQNYFEALKAASKKPPRQLPGVGD